ncbi:uncharacterized protein zmp:0000000991 [Brienomyrus brachyistius]|uniref:uncharacterized protein zmp:0000000991 n=1 Tax=Brienomyrus brachyistius TaxID=42636 RepID=UPI0020B36741|nr:uncharacterized protein zmp:0000000991 [Brienomyrus brachyistius]XP_048866689.1 uncharacterized protein zmp:0000000991 [Brienomyrus brachyistius]
MKGVSGQWFQEIQQSKRRNRTNSGHHTQSLLAPRETPLRSGKLLRKPGDRRENHDKAVSPSRASFRSRVTSLLAFRFLQKGSASRRSRDGSFSFAGASGPSSRAGDQDHSGSHLSEQGPHPDFTNDCPTVQQQEDSEGAPNHRPSEHHVDPRKPETRPGQKKACYPSVPEEPRKPIFRDQIDLCVAHKRGSYHNSLTDSLGEPPVTDSLRESTGTDLLKVSIITDSLGESTITDALGESTSIKFHGESTLTDSLGESAGSDLLRESTGTDLLKDSAVFLLNQPSSGIAFHTEQTSDCQRNSDLPKSNLVPLPIVASSSGLKRSNSLPTLQLQSDETPHSELPAHLNPLATMLPPSVVTVVAPHWTGKFRRPKQGAETTQAVKEANGRSQEVRRSSYVFKEQQTLRHRNSVSQSFLGRNTVQDKDIFHGPDTPQRQPATESARGLVGWLPERTTSRIPLSASVSLDNSKKISTGSSSSLVHPGTGHCSSLDVHHHRRISEVCCQQPPVTRFKGSSSPSSILLSLRGGGSALGSPGTLSSSIYATTPRSHPSSTTNAAKSAREGQLQYTRGDGSDRLYFIKSQTLPRRSTLPWRNHNQKDAAGLDHYDHASLGYPLSHHTLPGPADVQNPPDQSPDSLSATINLRNNQKSSNAHNTFTFPRNSPSWTPDTRKVLPSYTVSNPTHPSSFSTHDMPTSQNNSSNVPNQSDKLRTPSQMFNSRNMKSVVSFSQSKDISPKEGAVPTHTLEELNSATPLSPMAVISPRTPERSCHFGESPMTLCPTGETNPTTLGKSSNSFDSSEIHRILVVRIPASPNVDHSTPPRSMAVTSPATPIKSSQFVDNSVTHRIRAVISPVYSTGAFQGMDHPVTLNPPDATSPTRSARSSSTTDNSDIHRSIVMNSPSSLTTFSYSVDNSKTHSPKAVTSPISPRSSSHSVDNSIFHSPGVVSRSSSPAVSHQDVNSSVSHNPLFLTTSVLPTELPQNIDDKKVENVTTSTSASSRSFNFLDSTNVRTHSPVSLADLTRLPQSSITPVVINGPSLSIRSSLNNASIQNPTSQNNSNLPKESPNSINNTKILSSTGVITLNKSSDVESSKTDRSTASSSPLLLEIPPIKLRNSRIPSLEGLSSSTANVLSRNSEGASLTHSGDTACSPSPLSCPVLQTRSICNVGALKTYSSERQYSPPRVVSPTQKSPDPELRKSPLSPTENNRLASWRQHSFHSRHPAWSSAKDTHSEAAHRLSSDTASLDATVSRSSQPLSPLPDSKRMFSSESVVDIPTYSEGFFDLSGNVKLSSPGLHKQALNLNVSEVSDNIFSPETKTAEKLRHADCGGSGYLDFKEQGKNPVLRKKPTGIVVSIDEVWYQSANLRAKDEKAPEKPLRDHRFVSIQEQNSHKSLLTLTSKKDHTSPISPVVATEFYFSECETIEVKENQGRNNSDVMSNGTKMSFSSKQFEDELQTLRKKSRVEMPLIQSRTSSSVSSTGKEDVSRVLKPSNHKNIIEREVTGFHPDYSQASWLTEENNQPKNASETDRISSSSNCLFDKSRSSSYHRSPCSPLNSHSVSVERYTLVPGPRRSSLSPRSSQISIDFDSDDADNENVFYRGSLERKSKRKKTISFSEVNDYQVCVGGQVGAADRTGNVSLSRSLKDISQESQSHPFSDFSLKAGRSFSVSNVHASRPSGSARMATVPRMTSIDSLRGTDILDIGPKQRSRAHSCSIDQATYGDESGKQVTPGRNRSPPSLHTPSSVQADELSPSPPPSPLFSPPRMSRAPSSSPRSSLTSPDNLSPRGCLPSRGYKSSLSDLGESDSDTTTDDEYYLSGDKGEKETEL